MRIAVTYEDGQVFQHFGHTEQFKLYDIEDGKITDEQVVSTNGQGHGALAWLLKEIQADILICGGIGMGARMALQEAGIELLPGVQGPADEAVEDLLKGQLLYNPDETCNHHDHDHECGEHECGGEQHCGCH